MTGVNTCRHCRGKGTCYRSAIPRGIFRTIKFSCDSCIRVEGFENSIEVQKVVNCNVCRGSGLLPGANTFFQEYIKPKTFPSKDKQNQLKSEEPKMIDKSEVKLLGDKETLEK